MKYVLFAYLRFYSYNNENPTNYHSERSLNFKDVGHKYFTSHFPQKITSAMEEDILILDYIDIVLIQTIQYHNKRPCVWCNYIISNVSL